MRVVTKELFYQLYTVEERTYTDISQILGIPKGTLTHLREKLDIAKRPPPKDRMGPPNKMTDEKKALAYKMKKAGKTIYQIYTALGVSRTSVVVATRETREKEEQAAVEAPDELADMDVADIYEETEKIEAFPMFVFAPPIKPCNSKKIQKAIQDAKIDMTKERKQYTNMILGEAHEKLCYAKSA